MYAAASIGAILVPLNPNYKVLELARALMHSKAKLLIAAPSNKGVDILQTVVAALRHVQQSAAEADKLLEHVVTLAQSEHGEPSA